MNRAEQALTEISELDEMADRDSLIHRFSASAKLFVTVAYILTVMSFGKYDIAVLFMAVYPYILFQLSGIRFRTCIRKMRYVLPLVLLIGLFNPLLDQGTVSVFGHIVSAGWISFAVIAVKGVLALSASFLLIGTARIEAVCAVLRKLRLPKELVTVLLLTYRYLSVMTEEAAVMSDAYALRAPKQKGIAFSAWGSFTGQMLLRSMDRAKELYSAMVLRGYDGTFHYADPRGAGFKDYVYMLGWTVIFLAIRTGGMQ